MKMNLRHALIALVLVVGTTIASGQQQGEAVASVGFGGGLTISAPPLVTEGGGSIATNSLVIRH